MTYVLETLRLVQQGRIVPLAKTRFRGMPQLPGHPQLELLSYRTPHGLRVAGEEPWGSNDAGCSGFTSELMLATAHTGAHIDARAHVSAGSDDHWYGGGTCAVHLGDFGPQTGDASELSPIWARGVLLDVAHHEGVDALPRGASVTASQLEAVADAQGVDVRAGDVLLVRTGYLSRWPDAAHMAQVAGSGVDLAGAGWLSERRVLATGSDTESYEVVPSVDDGVFPVHAHLIVEHGIFIMENVDLEELAREEVYEFLFIALPLKIRGATASMIDPIAVI